MKKIMILGAGLLFAGFAQAQTSTLPTFGVKGGINIAKFSGSPDPNSDSRAAFSVGLFSNIPIASGFSFEPSVEFSQKGSQYYTIFGETEVRTKMISYIDLPLMAKYNVTPAFGIYAGPQVAFFVDQETRAVNPDDNDEITTFERNNSNYSKSLAGAKVGLSYNFGSVLFNASYASDLQNLYKENINNHNLKNQVINLGLAYSFK